MARRRNASKPVIRESFTLYTPESIEAGDAAEHGWIDEEGVDMTPDEYDVEEGVTAVDKAVKHLRSEGASEPSSSSFHPGIWYASMHDADMRTGEQEEHHFHLDGFSPEEQREVFMRVKGARRFNPRHGRRANPPLSEHMESDDLAVIAHHLGPRLAADPSEGAEFALAVVDACIDGLVAKKPVGEYAPATGFEQHLMQARRHLVSAVEGAHPRQRHNPRHR